MELKKMSKTENIVRASIPGRVNDLIWNDEEFFREITLNKKYQSADVKFPRYDQYMEEDMLKMAFALAGYSPEDISVSATDTDIVIQSSLQKEDDVDKSGSEAEVAQSSHPKPALQVGSIIRGIARRNFKVRFTLHSLFNPLETKATMKNGLLEVSIPKKSLKQVSINVMES